MGVRCFVLLLAVTGLLWLPMAAHAQVYPAPEWSTPSPGSFVTLAESDLAGLASVIPTAYPVPAVDTSTWSTYDVTTVGGTNPAGAANFSSCANLNNTGTADNTTALRCMLMNMGDEALLYFPNGIYDIADSPDGISLFRPQPQYDRRGLVGQSRNAIINLIADFRNPVVFLEGEEMVYNAGPTSWGGGAGAPRGSTVLNVASSAGFSATRYAPGSWVHLTANQNSVQDAAQRMYLARVVAVSPGQITIATPLPEDFTGGGAQAQAWTPAEDWVLRDLTIRYEDGNHLDTYFSFLVGFRGMANTEVTNVAFRNAYRNYISVEFSADLRFHGNDFTDMTWDKATNGYGLTIANTSRAWFHDNHIEHVTGIAFSNNSQEVMATFNDIRAPAPNPDFDVSCRENTGDGGNNDCIVQVSSHLYHGTTVGSGYTHCSTREEDLLGWRGDPSCRGTAAGALYACAEWHDRSASNTLFMRNYCEGPVFFDNTFGPGRNNFFYGNWLADDPVNGTEEFNTNAGSAGDFAFRDAWDGTPAGYLQNSVWANNLLEGSFGVLEGYNAYGGAVQVHDMVIAGQCWDVDAPGHDPDGGVCSTTSGLRPGTGGVWQNNAVGRNTRLPGYNRTMPTLPGFDDWPPFSVAPEASGPYVGPEMGDPDTTQRCLPAWQRFNGGC